MSKFIHTNLKTENNHIIYNYDYLKPYMADLELFLSDKNYMQNKTFAKSMIMPEEIKANNHIEGITDDLTVISDVMRNRNAVSPKVKQRISNIYNGYNFVLTHSSINKDSLKELYAILSKNLLIENDRNNMGSYYRTKPVYILNSSRLDIDPILGMPAEKLNNYMDNFFDYVNGEDQNDTIEIYLKSQIMHFYFVYIHPYFDINGRTSRTVSMWHLLNNRAFPYVIFNRAIAFNKQKYYDSLTTSRDHDDVTIFLKYMLMQVQKGLEKEEVIHSIKENIPFKLSKEDTQIIEYFLSLKGNLTIKDLVYIYNNYNNPRKANDLAPKVIEPLIEKGIFINRGNTKKMISEGQPNENLSLNSDLITTDKSKMKYLKLGRYIK
jgi:Fic family protein